MTSRSKHRFGPAGRLSWAVLAAVIGSAPAASAQLDQLLFLKRVPPTVIVVVDTSFRMLEDGEGRYYDPSTYKVNDDTALAEKLGVSGATTYRRIYHNLKFTQAQDANTRFEADSVEAVPDTLTARYSSFWRTTRLDIAQRGIGRAIALNRGSRFRWGLMKLPQTTPAWRTAAVGCDKPVAVAGLPGASEASPSCVVNGKLGVFAPTVGGSNAAAAATTATLVAPAANTAASVLDRVMGRVLPDLNQYLIPAGRDTSTVEDRPLTAALAAAKAQAVTAATGDTACPTCRNTIVVLVVGGKDPSAAVEAKASEFLNLEAGGVPRRVPIYVVGVKPADGDVPQLRAIATNSGGLYVHATTAADVTRGVHLALQAGFGRWAELNAGEPSEYVTVSPVVGTVNLEDAISSTAATLPNTRVTTPQGTAIPQRNNILITSGFAIGKGAVGPQTGSPGFEGRMRAFRVYKPVSDSTKPSGYTFTKDGTPLWPDRDGRPHLAGVARTPLDPAARNIYTYVPGRGMVPFDRSHLNAFASQLALENPFGAGDLVDAVRAMPLGAIVGSMPAVMDAPSMDPPPDDAYGRPDGTGTYAGDHKDRRTIIWVGANDGMLHAIDARTGYEVWAFIPFNLLPKLQVLPGGQPVEQFWYFVDHSAKIAEVKVNGEWRTHLVIGEGPGGTFYQAFDVTEAGMGGPPPASDDYHGVLQTFADPDRVQFKWSFPDYSSFDPAIQADVAVADATPGGIVRFYGDLKVSATAAEKSVGFAWSDPAIGPLDLNRSVSVVISGSGYFPEEAQAANSPLLARRNMGVGRSLYLIRVEDGKLLGNPGGDSCASGAGCLDVGDVASNGWKNALQADPTVTGDAGGYVAKRAYIGDLDGKYWRFDFTPAGSITKTLMTSVDKPIYASSALMSVGTAQQYIFFATGSDLLPTSAPGGSGAGSAGTGVFRLYGIKDNGAAGAVAFTADLAPVTDNSGVAAGERPSASPSVAGDIVFFTTTVETVTPSACADFQFNLWALTYQGGSAYLPAGGTAPSGGKKNNNNPPPAAPIKSGTGRATAPFVVDQHLYFGTTGTLGAGVEAFGDPNDFNNGIGQVGVRILSWREIRR